MIYAWLAIAFLFAIVTLMILLYSRRVADIALTEQFRAAESISQGRLPQKWQAQIQQRLSLQRAIPLMRPGVTGTRLATEKLDRLARFFERSPFFENNDARQMLLAKFQETRSRWQSMTWDQILEETRDERF